jgi:HAD superfamily hydrolase (TIGR01509 family)
VKEIIFWDNDGVLVDTEELFYRTTRSVLAEAGVEFTREDYADLVLRRDAGVWSWVARRGVAPGAIDRLKQERNRRYHGLLRTEPLVKEGVRETLAALAGQYRMAVVTSSGKEDFDAVHASSGLLPYFEFVLARGDYAAVKPDPAPYETALSQAGVSASQAICVEDSERGMRSAEGAGLRCVVVRTELAASCRFDGAVEVVKSARDLPGVIGKLL